MKIVPSVILFLCCLHTTPKQIVVVNADCVKEFDKCVVQRDCCADLICVTGDWQYTTDSTCPSKKSQDLESRKYTLDQRKLLVIQYYQKINNIQQHKKASVSSDDERIVGAVTKTRDEIDSIIQKYRTEFPKLVSKLERKYQIEFDIDLKSEQAETQKLREDL